MNSSSIYKVICQYKLLALNAFFGESPSLRNKTLESIMKWWGLHIIVITIWEGRILIIIAVVNSDFILSSKCFFMQLQSYLSKITTTFSSTLILNILILRCLLPNLIIIKSTLCAKILISLISRLLWLLELSWLRDKSSKWVSR